MTGTIRPLASAKSARLCAFSSSITRRTSCQRTLTRRPAKDKPAAKPATKSATGSKEKPAAGGAAKKAAAEGVEEIVYPGSFTLNDIQNDLVQKKSQRFENLTKLELLPDAPDGEHRSLATLTEVPFGTPFGRLSLFAVPEGQLASVIATQDIAQRDLLFAATIWVENEQKRVAAFRKRLN